MLSVVYSIFVDAAAWQACDTTNVSLPTDWAVDILLKEIAERLRTGEWFQSPYSPQSPIQ